MIREEPIMIREEPGNREGDRPTKNAFHEIPILKG